MAAAPVRNGAVEWTARPLAPNAVWSTLASVKPAGSPLVTESTSTMAQQLRWLPTIRPASSSRSPAAEPVGVCLPPLALRWETVPRRQAHGGGDHRGRVLPVLGAGDLFGAQHRLPVVSVVMRNEEYSIFKSFAVLEETPGVQA